MTKDEINKLLDTMKSTSTETVWKSQDECKGYLKAIDEIKLVLEDVPESVVDCCRHPDHQWRGSQSPCSDCGKIL